MSPVIPRLLALTARKFLLAGTVQGVGMRPWVVRLARESGVHGFVRNDDAGVEIHAEGNIQEVELFSAELQNKLPPSSQITQLVQSSAQLICASDFRIAPSRLRDSVATAIPRDRVVCSLCLAESMAPESRRHRHPFVTCTDCGPRYSFIQSMPFDRACTSMDAFSLCPECAREYAEPKDRRFHSQTNACPDCGPKLTFTAADGASDLRGMAAFRAAVSMILDGRILALKGVGGYQLVCDATCTRAVRELRLRKRRPNKPLAVMVSSVDAARLLADVSIVAENELSSPQNPIVLLPLRSSGNEAAEQSRESQLIPFSRCDGSSTPGRDLGGKKTDILSSAINDGLGCIGVMLPTSSLHALLLKEAGRPCVVTSGNCGGDPLAFEDSDAKKKLMGVADGWLRHDRAIVRPIDDSVVRILGDRRVVFRAGRGCAPVSLPLDANECILATGGHQKVAVALTNGKQCVLGPHLGDMNTVESRQRFSDHVQQICKLYRAHPTFIAHDLHPDYFTSRWAADQGAQSLAVQHHHAHTVSGMIEHDWLERTVLGVCFDGTGYGTDQTIWGGEFIVCTADSFHRVARLRPFPLFGGDAAIKEPWRIASALLHEAGVEPSEWCAEMSGVVGPHWKDVQQIRQNGSRHSHPVTSSVGRLFDGVASLLLKIPCVSFEGEAAMRLESAGETGEGGTYDIPICKGNLMELDWRPMIREIVNDLRIGLPIGSMATKFTRGLAHAVGAVCHQFHELPIVLSGGCFQNAALCDFTAVALRSHGEAIGFLSQIPPNDGGLAAGQLAVAAATLRNKRQTTGGP